MPVPTTRHLGRRALLVSAGSFGMVATVAACGGGGADSSAPASTPGASDQPPIDAVRREVATSERALIAAYDAALTAFPALATELSAIRAQHADHLAAMGDDGAEPAAAMAPASPQAAITALRAAEQQAARERRTSCVAAADPELARVLALIAASEQSHAAALRQAAST